MKVTLLRRLPLYFLIDISNLMNGEPINEFNISFQKLISDLKCNPEFIELVHLSVITFADNATVENPLTELMDFQLPLFKVQGSNKSFGEALDILNQKLEKEVVESSPSCKGDYEPGIFIFINGRPTDDWEHNAKILNKKGYQVMVNDLSNNFSESSIYRNFIEMKLENESSSLSEYISHRHRFDDGKYISMF